ncbi:hypothetical protein Adeh_1794 [Anaeromyxobacter dehalogenans 2CP-C]|uniref:Uncharacterized protein n=1 Tax=Anaeromyxobacter dehalogenans (strain 2CP-C) TaxID=290397 RepID=Q2IIU0_ANADE|nr:hypothetical protein Adeh_1794 [Anaeromyxobacter dehalogenans 2CP-C]
MTHGRAACQVSSFNPYRGNLKPDRLEPSQRSSSACHARLSGFLNLTGLSRSEKNVAPVKWSSPTRQANGRNARGPLLAGHRHAARRPEGKP